MPHIVKPLYDGLGIIYHETWFVKPILSNLRNLFLPNLSEKTEKPLYKYIKVW